MKFLELEWAALHLKDAPLSVQCQHHEVLQAALAKSFTTRRRGEKLLSVVINDDDVWLVAKNREENPEQEIMIQVNFRGTFSWLMSHL